MKQHIKTMNRSRYHVVRFLKILFVVSAAVIFSSCATLDTSRIAKLRAYAKGIEFTAYPLVIKRYESTTVYWGCTDSVALKELAIEIGVAVGLLQGQRTFTPMADTTFYADFLDDIHPMLKSMVGELSVEVKVTPPGAKRASALLNDKNSPIITPGGGKRPGIVPKRPDNKPQASQTPASKPPASRTSDLDQCKLWKIQFLNAWLAGEDSFRVFAESNPDNPFAEEAAQILREGRYSRELAREPVDDYRSASTYEPWTGEYWEGGSWKGHTRESDFRLNLRGADCDDDQVGTLYFDTRDVSSGRYLQQVFQHELELIENGRRVEILSLDRMYHSVNAPVDFVFVLDATGSMQPYITALMHDIHFFTRSLSNSGIDFRLGLVVYGEAVRSSWGITSNAYDFSEMVSQVYPYGGRDVNVNGNALDAIAMALELPWRDNAYKNIVVISDAGIHGASNSASYMGRTHSTRENIAALLNRENVALSVVGPANQSVDGNQQLNYRAIHESCLENNGIDIRALIHSGSTTSYSNLTDGSGGHFFPIPPSNERVDLREIFSEFSGYMTQHLYRLRYRRNVRWSHSSVELFLRLHRANSRTYVQDSWHCKRNWSVSDIYFPIGKYRQNDIINSQDLRDIGFMLRENPGLSVSLEGYTCDINTLEYNFNLSWQRLKSVENYLRRYCHPSQIRVTTGFGKHKYVQELNHHVDRDYNLESGWSRRMNRCVRIGLIENQYDPDAYPQIDRPNGKFKYTIKLLNPWEWDTYDESGRRSSTNNAFKSLESIYDGKQFFYDGMPYFGGFYRKAEANAFIRNVLHGAFRREFSNGQFIVTTLSR